MAERGPALGLRVVADAEAMSRAAAEMIVGAVKGEPDLLLGVASGSTPTRTYELLGEAERRAPGLFAKVRVIKLDEWGGLAMDDPATCEVYVRQKLLRPLGVSDERYCGWDSAADPAQECARVSAWLRGQGRIGLCVLGLGLNGHLAFNEPGAFLTAGPHVAKLSGVSIGHPMVKDARKVPTHGLTVGIGDIIKAREVLLLVSGAAKADQVTVLMRDAVSPWFPASFLWMHPDVSVICDEAAAKDYLRSEAAHG